MNAITTVTGNESFREGMSRLALFAVRSNDFANIGSPPHFTEFPNRLAVLQAGRPSLLRAATSGPDEQGRFWRQRLDAVPDNLIMILYATRSVGRMSTSCRMVLRTRNTGPMQRILFQRVQSALSNPFDVEVSGRFDIITVRDAIRLHGAMIGMRDIQSYDPARRATLFSIQELASETAPVRQARTERVRVADTVVKVTTAAPARRAVDLD